VDCIRIIISLVQLVVVTSMAIYWFEITQGGRIQGPEQAPHRYLAGGAPIEAGHDGERFQL